LESESTPKIKIFLWYLWKSVILSKDNLAKRQWKGCTHCCFCSEHETIQLLFFYCPMARLMWFAMNVTFGITKPTNIAALFGLGLEVLRVSKGLY
jgi:hypothetical protein